MLSFPRWSLKIQLVLLVIISIIPALGIILYSGVEQRRIKVEEIQRSAFSVMQAIANRQQLLTESTRQILTTLSRIPEVQNLDRQACNALFKDLLQENPVYANIFMLSKDGIVLSSAVPTPSLDMSDRKYFQDIVSTRRFSTGEHIVGRIVKIPVFTFSYPILNPQGDLDGVLAMPTDLTRYDHILSDARLPEKSVLILTDHKGVRLYRYPALEDFIGRQAVPELMKPMMEGPMREFSAEWASTASAGSMPIKNSGSPGLPSLSLPAVGNT